MLYDGVGRVSEDNSSTQHVICATNQTAASAVALLCLFAHTIQYSATLLTVCQYHCTSSSSIDPPRLLPSAFFLVVCCIHSSLTAAAIHRTYMLPYPSYPACFVDCGALLPAPTSSTRPRMDFMSMATPPPPQQLKHTQTINQKSLHCTPTTHSHQPTPL